MSVTVIVRKSMSQVRCPFFGSSVQYSSYTVYISSAPAPEVSISLNTEDTVYLGTELVITCTATVDPSVDTRFGVILTWTRESAEVMEGSDTNSGDGSGSGQEYTLMSSQYINISDTSDSGHVFNSTVTISPVNTTDSATYTCTASVNSTEGGDGIIISDTNSSDTVDITVEGE